MNIRYNAALRRYEAEFTSDFEGDYSSVKAAGFKTDGPPGWIWHTAKIPILNKLRENKPTSGLTITPEALEVYKVEAARYEQKAELKKKFSVLEKQAKKERKQKEQEAATTSLFEIPEGRFWIGPEDLPPKPPFVSEIAPRVPHAGPHCVVCGQPVYFYELQDPPTCLWCEMHPKKVLDKEPVI